MLGLANELYYGASFEERRALVEQALAMARRLGDDALVLDACEVGFVVAVARPTPPSCGWSSPSEAMDIATRLGNERAFVVAATLTAVVARRARARRARCGSSPPRPATRPSGCTCRTAWWSSTTC